MPQEQQRQFIRALGLGLEVSQLEPVGHINRVAALASSLAAELGLSDADIDAIELGAYLHDLGKYAVPRSILNKTQPLLEEEWQLVQAHVQFGAEMLAELPDVPSATQDIVLHHHERWDGNGYPQGLTGLAIPLAARLFAVVDAFVAMTADWSSRRAISSLSALFELHAERGNAFEPRMVDALARILKISVTEKQEFRNLSRHRSSYPINAAPLANTAMFGLINERNYLPFVSPALRQHLDAGALTVLDLLELTQANQREDLMNNLQAVQRDPSQSSVLRLNLKLGASWSEYTVQALRINHDNGTFAMTLLWIDAEIVFDDQMPLPNRLFTHAIGSSSAMMLLTDTEQRIVEASPAFLKSTGYHLEEILGRTPRFLQGARSSRDALEILRHGIEHGYACKTEVVNYRKDGTEFWVQITIDPIRGQDGRITHFLAVQHDVGERKRAEADAQRLLEVGQEAMLVTDLEGNLLQSNFIGGLMLGIDSLNTPFEPIWSFFTEADQAPIRQMLSVLLVNSQPLTLETKVAPRELWSRVMTWSITPFLPDQRLYWVGRDSTEQFHLNARLRHERDALLESEQRYRNLVDNINDSLIHVSANSRIEYANPAWTQISGFSKATTLAAKSALKFVHPRQRFAMLRLVWRAFSQKTHSFRTELQIVNRANRLRWVSAAIALHQTDVFSGLTLMLSDITSQKEALVRHHLSQSQEQLYGHQDLTAALVALVQFLGAQDAQILSPEACFSSNKSINPIFDPELIEGLSDAENTTLISLEQPAHPAYLVVRWSNALHLVETTTLYEFQSAISSAFERVLAYRELLQNEQVSKEFIEITMRAQEEERERIAMDLHDGPAQTMVSALRFLESSLELPASQDPLLKKQLERSLELIGRAIGQVRETISDLIPPDLEILGLRDVLHQRLEESAKEAAWQTEFDFATLRLRPDTEIALYRVVIEALNNVRKHAQAQKVQLSLKPFADYVQLELHDNGIGFDPSKTIRPSNAKHGIGTIAMGKRAALIGCEFELQSQIGQGTTIRLKIPNEQLLEVRA